MIRRCMALACAVLALTACARLLPATQQRSSQGPTAEEIWYVSVAMQNGREPNYDEKQHWRDQLDIRISAYLRQHPEDANSLQLSTFRFDYRVAAGMSKEMVLILFGPPISTTTSEADMERVARRYWPMLKGNVTEAWEYPLGWTLYFAGLRLTELTQYLPR
ncbi:MAG: hypothetical protein HY294_17595 [Candidatus Rokubacteria bacterium]|nr:hypothetical protein [Candidatus Rokubacteria bacterium]MBI3827805.1 hypothetical protein [Candidatus Rokubacteria bacterium]